MSYEVPNIASFDPRKIPMQARVIRDMANFDYSMGNHEILLSGSVGSAKSILLAHICIKHCLSNKNACVLVGRRALPDLKSTIFSKIVEHLEGVLIEVKHYYKHDGSAYIKFKNGSKIISRSWADKKYSKVRSLELSGAIIEELTENPEDHFYNEIKMRVGRLPNIYENFIISATNPDSPSHWAYKYFIEPNIELNGSANKHPTRHVYYSLTEDNPFLPKKYIEQLKRDLDPKMARRMLMGQWIEINDEVVYYAYDKSKNFVNDSYKVNTHYPVWISWDFNIGEGKPLSLCLFQFIDDKMHIFNEVVVQGMRTNDSLDEMDARGLLSYPTKYLITGDATGKSRDTRSNKSDYDLIEKYFANREAMNFEMKNFKANPPIRKRHNMVNSYCQNAAGEVRLFVYKDAKTVDEGLRLTNLKKGGNYIEDDSKHYQHITTSLGYGLHAAKMYTERRLQATIRL